MRSFISSGVYFSAAFERFPNIHLLLLCCSAATGSVAVDELVSVADSEAAVLPTLARLAIWLRNAVESAPDLLVSAT